MNPAKELSDAKFKAKKKVKLKEIKYLECHMREIRVELGLSLREVGKVTGISTTTLMRIESGGSTSLHVAMQLAQFFGMSVHDLWEPLKTLKAFPVWIKATY